MWFRFCVIVVLLSANLAKHDSKSPNEGNKEDTGAIFASVIKNISRVNNVLQELISNYEHLQKIYKSQENIQSESSDGEIDDVYKSKRYRVGLDMSENETPATERVDGYPATQIIWSDNNNDGGEDSENSSDSAEASNVTEYESLEKSPTPSEPAELKKAEIIFVDTPKPNVKKKKRKLTPDSVLAIPISEAPETKNKSIRTLEPTIKPKQKQKKKEKKHLSAEDPTKTEASNSEPKTTLTNAESKNSVEKKVHSEFFSPKKIWGDIIKNKPIQLEFHSEIALDKLRKDNNDDSGEPALRHRSKYVTAAALVNVTNQNQTEVTKRTISGSSEGLKEEDREEFQATVLREAYGDACMKVVIRKCFKACKAAGKSICDRYKCKANYKQKFTEFIKVGCLREFHGNTTEKSEETFPAENGPNDKDSDISVEFRRRDGETRLTNKSSNTSSPEKKDLMTWNKYLRSCLPHIQAGSRRVGEPTEDAHSPATSLSPDNLLPNLNILRDKYERACQKISNEKCKRACEYASTEVCKSFTCKSARKKAYKKQCKLKCKSAYGEDHRSRDHSKDSDSGSDNSGSSDSSTSNSS